MPFKKIEDEVLAGAFNKIDTRKTRRICHKENLENIKRVNEIKSKHIPKDRRLERLQLSERLRKKLENKKKDN